MKQRKDKATRARPAKPKDAEDAFDVWLQRSLHKLFDEVAKEPVPADLLRLIEEDREK